MPMLTTTNARLQVITAAAVLATLLGLALTATAHSQFLPAFFYGKDVPAGATIEAFIDSKSCAKTTATAAGEWVLQIESEAACGPTEGAAVEFRVDNVSATAIPAATWVSGGIPTTSIRTGYSLSGEGIATESGSGSEDGEADDGGGTNVLVFAGIGLVVLAVAGGGLYFMRRNSG
jgi:hypothetical protein